MCIIKMTSSPLENKQIFPKNFFDIGEKTFEYVFQHKPDYVQFTINDMKKCTGLFLEWQNYCKEKVKLNKWINKNEWLVINTEITERTSGKQSHQTTK